jgi:hypothetical protein
MRKVNRAEGRKGKGISQSTATKSRTAEKNIRFPVNGKLHQLKDRQNPDIWLKTELLIIINTIGG